MIQIYDKEFSQKRIATLIYIYLSCGGKLTENSFDNIAYKLYHYMEDLFTEDTMCITEEVKSRIETFKTIANTLPNPALSDGWVDVGTMNSGNYTNFELQKEYKNYTTGNIVELPFRIYHSATGSSNIYGRLGLKRISDGYLREISCSLTSTTVPTTAVYGVFCFDFASSTTLSYPYMKFYDANGSEVYTKKGTSLGSGINATIYDFKLNGLYYSAGDVNVKEYKEYDFTIDLSAMANINTDALALSDIYEANSIYIMENITLGCILGKKVNGESKDKKYELLKARLGEKVEANNNTPLRYITMLKNETTNISYALISDYPFTYYGKHTTNGIGIGAPAGSISTSKIFFEVWESSDGINFTPSSVAVGGATAAGDYKSTYSLVYITGCNKIEYSNYNIYLAWVDSTGYTLDSEFTRKEVGINECYKKSDEKLTLGTVGIGATIQYGSHKVENSSISPLHFQILDHSDNLNTLGEKITSTTYAKRPEKTVMLETVKIIDVLPMNLDTTATLQQNNLLLHRWLNSDKSAGNWFTAINENDKPITAENINSMYKNYYYNHRAGFLNSFSSLERDNLVSCELEDGYRGKVFLAQKGEEVAKDTKSVQPCYYRYSTSNRRYKNYMDILIHHLDASYLFPTETPEGKQMQYMWKRTMSSTVGNYYVSSTTQWAGQRGAGVVPVIFLSEELELEEIVNGSNPNEVVYRVILPEPSYFEETYNFDTVRYTQCVKNAISDVKREIQKVISDKYDIEKTVIKLIDALEKFDIRREVSTLSIGKYDLFKSLIADEIVKADIEASRTVKANDYYDISRYASSTIAEEYDIRKETLKVIADIFDNNKEIIREIIEKYDLEKTVVYSLIAEIQADIRKIVERRDVLISDMKREIVKQIEEQYDTKVATQIEKCMLNDLLLSVLAVRLSDFDIKRESKLDDTMCLDILKNVEVDSKVSFDIERIIAHYVSQIFDIRGEIEKREEIIADINKNVIKAIKERFDISLETFISLSTIYDIDTETVKEIIEKFDTMREIEALISIEYFDLLRKMRGENKVKNIILQEIVQTTDEYGLDKYEYRTIKELKGNIYDVKNTVEQLPALVSEKTKYIVITREKNIKGENIIEYDGKRYVIEAITRNRVFREIYLKEE